MSETNIGVFKSVKESPDNADSGVMRIVSEITEAQADTFATLCRLATSCYTETPGGKVEYRGKYTILAIYDYIRFAYRVGLTFEALRQIEKLGLIATTMCGLMKAYSTERYPLVHFTYGETVLSITEYAPNSFPIGNILLTKEGRYFAEIFDTVRFDEYEDMLREFFYKRALAIYEKPLLSISRHGNDFCYEKINREGLCIPGENV